MIFIENKEHLGKVVLQAIEAGLGKQLTDKLDYLATYANRPGCSCEEFGTRCRLFPEGDSDFCFLMERGTAEGTFEYWFNGGLIYQGPTRPADGSAPSFTVSLTKGNGWYVHT